VRNQYPVDEITQTGPEEPYLVVNEGGLPLAEGGKNDNDLPVSLDDAEVFQVEFRAFILGYGLHDGGAQGMKPMKIFRCCQALMYCLNGTIFLKNLYNKNRSLSL